MEKLRLATAWLGSGCTAEVQSDSALSEDETLIANAMSAAPENVGRDATIVIRAGMGELRVLRAGTSEWTCLPDSPRIPGNMPMCVDRAGWEWMQAMMKREEPPDGPVSVAYLLQGSAFPSFDDPEVKEPPAGSDWHLTGPVLIIQNVRGRLDGYPSAERDLDAPFVMYRGTPYEHLMIPVGIASP